MTEGMEASFCSCDYETFEWYQANLVTARKEHRCCECGATIAAGELYERAMGKCDGRLDNFKTCIPCTRIRRDYCAPYEGLREVVWEYLGVDISGKWDVDTDGVEQ